MSEPIHVRTKHGRTITVTGYGTLPAEQRHDFESSRDAAEGGLERCAVCGCSRGAGVHL